MATRIDVREGEQEVYPVEVIYGIEGCSVRMVEQSDMAITVTESGGMSVQVYNGEIDKLIEALQEIKKYVPSSAEDKPEEQPKQDMRHPANWRVGDIVEAIEDYAGHYSFMKGDHLRLVSNHSCGDWNVDALEGKYEDGLLFEVDELSQLKWVSRPQNNP